MNKGNPAQPKVSALSIAVKCALCLGIAPAMVTAQDSNANVEEVTVTGSRIPRLDPQLVTPVQIYDAGYIENTGATSIQDFLFTASFAGPALFNENATLSQTAGTANFDSRGFGADYVVVLMNGRRLPGDPIFGNPRSNLNLVPLAAVERIEYLSTGASAIYGADAVQGVINIITKQQHEGLEVRLQYGNDNDTLGSKTGYALTGGVVSDKGFATVSYEFTDQQAVAGATLPLIRSAISPDGTDGTSTIGAPPDSVTYLDFGPADGGPATSYPASGCPTDRIGPPGFGTTAGNNCNYDFAPLYQAIPAQERQNFLANAEYELDDRLTYYGEFRMSRNVTQSRNGAAPAIFNITGAASLADVDADLGTDLVNSSAVYMLRRATDAGPRATDNTNTAYSITLGGRYEFSSGHELDINAQSIDSEMNRVGVGGQLSRSRVEAAVADGSFDPIAIYDPQFFLDNGLAIATQRQATGTDDRLNVQLTGMIGDSEVGYAVGGQAKKEVFIDRSDAVSSEGDVSGGAGSNGAGERDVTAFFGELSYSPIDSVELSVAARYDDYSWEGRDQSIQQDVSNGDSATTYMVGGSWRPMENLMLRASYGTGFKAPTLGELYLGGSFGVNRAVDRLVCDQTTADPSATMADIDNACSTREIRSVSGGNPNLSTETSTNLSLGMVWEPLDSWSVAVDYYNIEVEDKIGSLTTQEILNNEAQYASLVNRVGGTLSSPDAFVSSNSQNLNKETGEGIDLSTQKSWDMNTGALVADARIAYLLSHERQTSAVQPLCEDAGTTSEPEWRVNGQLGWQAPKWSATMTFRYLGSTDENVGGREDGTCNVSSSGFVFGADSYLELGLRGTYALGDNTELAGGIINLTDEDPVYSLEAAGEWPFYDQSLYDPRGTRFYVNFKHSF